MLSTIKKILSGRTIRAFLPENINKRFYYAAQFQDQEKTSARIISDDNQRVVLQSLTKKQLSRVLVGPASWRHFMLGRDWQNILINHPDKGIHIDSEYLRAAGSSWLPTYRIIDQQQLYAIPQDIWDSFVATFKNQTIVDNLNLKVHRHLWDAYNFAHSANSLELASKRAYIIGTYHFLLPFSVESIDALCVFYHGSVVRLLKNQLSMGIFSLETLSKLHQGLSPGFINKAAHCTDHRELMRLAGAVQQYSGNDPKCQLTTTSLLFSSRQEPVQFAKALNVYMRFQSSLVSTYLFFGSRKKWLDYTEDDLCQFNFNHIEDYSHALFHDLIKREILYQLSKVNGVTNEVSNLIKHKFLQRVIGTNTACQLNYLQERWHRNLNYINAEKPLDNYSSWQPLFDDLVLDNISIHVICSIRELKEHGVKMKHCVGGYAEKCLNNEINIIEFNDNTGYTSTLELAYGENNKIEMKQHRSFKNIEPDKSHQIVALQLLQILNNNELVIHPDRKNDSGVKIHKNRFDYDINNISAQEAIYNVYKEKKLLPAKLIASDYHHMLRKSGLLEVIEGVIEQNVRVSPSRLL
ncbi:MAG: PcfJ domain-containing protein [Gammaproteobacteria bacterium]|nr:PcfJ domain-containing protein [Gammaproteobacteria bacterium]